MEPSQEEELKQRQLVELRQKETARQNSAVVFAVICIVLAGLLFYYNLGVGSILAYAGCAVLAALAVVFFVASQKKQ